MEFLRRLGGCIGPSSAPSVACGQALGGLLLRTVAWIVVAWLSLLVAVWLTPGSRSMEAACWSR